MITTTTKKRKGGVEITIRNGKTVLERLSFTASFAKPYTWGYDLFLARGDFEPAYFVRHYKPAKKV